MSNIANKYLKGNVINLIGSRVRELYIKQSDLIDLTDEEVEEYFDDILTVEEET